MAITLPRSGQAQAPAQAQPAARVTSPPAQAQTAAPRTQPAQSQVASTSSSDTFGTAQEEMFKILGRAQSKGASDIILSVGLPPMIRVSGSLVRDQFPVLNPDMVKKLVYSFLRQDQIAIFEQSFELDMALSVPGIARYRVNVFRQKKCVGAAFRSITETIPSFEELGLPKPIETMALLPRGLVLVTGPTGSGKSSTLAAMLDLINQRKNGHIITIEDPIEYVHRHKNCVVEQRELKTDTESFTIALRQSLRQNPDTILVGEMRDLETISAAISAAETGHLVMSTLHTQDAAQTVDRIIDVFPSHQQEQVRAQLSTTLRGIVSQQLLPRKNGGRVAAREILLVTSAIANLIREGKSYQINSAIQTGAKLGMVSMDMSLMDLYSKGLVTYEDAVSKAIYPENIKPNF